MAICARANRVVDSVGTLLGAPLLAAERERRAFPEYILAGLTGAQIVRAKWRSLAALALVLVAAPLPILALCFPLGGLSPMDFVAANALCLGVALASCAWGLVVSAQHSTVSEAMRAALFELFPLGAVWMVIVFLAALLPLEIIFVFGALLALAPILMLRKTVEEVEWLAFRLESEAPGVEPKRVWNSLGLRPGVSPSLLIGLSAENLRESEALFSWSSEAERSQFDFSPSWFDLWLQKRAAFNLLARREVAAGLRDWRLRFVIGEPAPFFTWPWCLGCGMVLLCANILLGAGKLSALIWGLCALFAGVQVAVMASNGFIRERAARMLWALQLSALRPWEMVAGKTLAPLLLGARFWLFPLLVLLIGTFASGFWAGLGLFSLTASWLALCSALGVFCSLIFRHAPLSLGTTLGFLAFGFAVCPLIFQPLLLQAPAWFGQMWVEPLRVFWGLSPDGSWALAIWQIAFWGAISAILSFAGAVWRLARLRPA